MFVSSGQANVFIVCLAFGFCCGVIFNVFHPIKKLLNNVLVAFSVDIFCFFIISILFCQLLYFFDFPSLRAYMLLGVFVGLFIYFKSLYITIAKVLKKLYNILVKKFLHVFLLLKKFVNNNLRKGRLKHERK